MTMKFISNLFSVILNSKSYISILLEFYCDLQYRISLSGTCNAVFMLKFLDSDRTKESRVLTFNSSHKFSSGTGNRTRRQRRSVRRTGQNLLQLPVNEGHYDWVASFKLPYGRWNDMYRSTPWKIRSLSNFQRGVCKPFHNRSLAPYFEVYGRDPRTLRDPVCRSNNIL